MADQDFWQEFTFKILETLGIDPKKTPVAKIEIDVFGKHRIPTVRIEFNLYEKHELVPIMEIFQAAEWKNTREKVAKPD